MSNNRRLYTPDKLGEPCPDCGFLVPKALNTTGILYHPTCGITPADYP